MRRIRTPQVTVYGESASIPSAFAAPAIVARPEAAEEAPIWLNIVSAPPSRSIILDHPNSTKVVYF